LREVAPSASIGIKLAKLGFINYSGFTYYTLDPVLRMFPFNFILLPENYSIGPMGGTYAISYGVTSTLVLSGINILLCILTLFVVPMLVLENKRLSCAIAESCSLIKKIWGEIICCFLIFGLILLVISLTSLLFPITYGIVAPGMLYFWRPGTEWIAGATLYMLAWFVLAMVGTTAGGISLAGLYSYAKTGQIPGEFTER